MSTGYSPPGRISPLQATGRPLLRAGAVIGGRGTVAVIGGRGTVAVIRGRDPWP